MTREKVIEILNKLTKRNYNEPRPMNEYASGMSAVYARAILLLQQDDPCPMKQVGCTGEGEPCMEVSQQIEDESDATNSYLLPFLTNSIIGSRVDNKGVIRQLQYYLGRINASKAVVKLLSRTNEVQSFKGSLPLPRKRYVCNICGKELENHGTEIAPNWWHRQIMDSNECILLWRERNGDGLYTKKGIEVISE